MIGMIRFTYVVVMSMVIALIAGSVASVFVCDGHAASGQWIFNDAHDETVIQITEAVFFVIALIRLTIKTGNELR